jgi:hypothetical protein
VRRFLVLVLALACSRPAPRDDFTLRIAVVGPMTPLGHDMGGSASVYAQDLVYQPMLRPEGSGFVSQVFAQWERRAGGRLRALVADGLRFSDGSAVEVADVVRSIRAVGLLVRAEGKWLEIEPGPQGRPVDTGLITSTLFKPTPAGELGTGAFRLVSGDERRMILERRTPAPGRIRRVELVSVASSREALVSTLKGEVNAVTNLDDRQVELVQGVPGLQILRARGPHALAVIFNSRRLSPALRREVAEALPIEEIAELSQGKGCGPVAGRRLTRPISAGPPLDIAVAIVDASVERAGLALRRGLGPRGGHIVGVSFGEALEARAESALTVDNVLAWPPAVGAFYWRTGTPANVTGYSNPAYDAAVGAGDFERAEAELEKDPPVLLLCRRERIAAVDSRIRNATIGSWGYLDTLPDWEVSP